MAGKGWSNPGSQSSRYENNDISQVRHRCIKSKLEAKAKSAKATNEIDNLGNIEGNANYHGGKRALRFQADGGGFVYYPSGNVAVCVSVVNSYQKNFFFLRRRPLRDADWICFKYR